MNESAKYSATDIAYYCIYYCSQELESPISNLQIQKILYYIQASFLVNLGIPCFKEEITAWKYGPVVEDVYREFRAYSASKLGLTKEPFIDWCADDRSLVNNICACKSKKHAFELVNDTHEEDPWTLTDPGEHIDIDVIKKYFLNNLNRLRGGTLA